VQGRLVFRNEVIEGGIKDANDFRAFVVHDRVCLLVPEDWNGETAKTQSGVRYITDRVPRRTGRCNQAALSSTDPERAPIRTRDPCPFQEIHLLARMASRLSLCGARRR